MCIVCISIFNYKIYCFYVWNVLTHLAICLFFLIVNINHLAWAVNSRPSVTQSLSLQACLDIFTVNNLRLPSWCCFPQRSRYLAEHRGAEFWVMVPGLAGLMERAPDGSLVAPDQTGTAGRDHPTSPTRSKVIGLDAQLMLHTQTNAQARAWARTRGRITSSHAYVIHASTRIPLWFERGLCNNSYWQLPNRLGKSNHCAR